ncbi:MAG: Mur ligase family protein, partial [Candidatus Gottesmanbacteria bacterium]
MMDKKDIRRIHFVGITGVAMTALAIYVKERGIQVSGSDVNGVFPTHKTLKKAGISIQEGFSPDHVRRTSAPDVVIFTGAHGGKENVEVQAARDFHIPVMSHGEALGFFMKSYEQISIAGSHGKTTTSAMLATIFSVANIDPSYAIGCGDILGVGLPGHCGKGTMFIAEADEYITDPYHDAKPRFLWQNPDILVVTNIDFDHPDAYASLSAVKDAFLMLQKQQQGKQITIINADDPESVGLIKDTQMLQYGFSPRADIQITHVGFGKERTFFTLSMHGVPMGEFVLKVPGRHNVLNATAAAACAVSYGISWDDIKKGLALFGGTKRRFEKLADENGILIFDDYAHHPTEIEATLEATRAWFPKRRIITIFQPHT